MLSIFLKVIVVYFTFIFLVFKFALKIIWWILKLIWDILSVIKFFLSEARYEEWRFNHNLDYHRYGYFFDEDFVTYLRYTPLEPRSTYVKNDRVTQEYYDNLAYNHKDEELEYE
ncbi:hypothetical protein SAMN02745179_00739 [Mycoplasmopsis agassizii]|uniref:Uncharacterized protein n=1 Tax=Mycoplasmopsis agassizii TaxID=33922 RepID=A0ABX4H4L0_9BACT|nr:hypothetical protein CJF60_03785 [Mycoplasmopsis agassizii]SMC18652.1 hypothetical protein SAMN02745179_00739 [Mycoplasmopsis agassizii]